MRNVGFAFPVYRRLSRQARPGQLTPPPPFKVSTSVSVFTQELARLSAALHVCLYWLDLICRGHSWSPTCSTSNNEICWDFSARILLTVIFVQPNMQPHTLQLPPCVFACVHTYTHTCTHTARCLMLVFLRWQESSLAQRSPVDRRRGRDPEKGAQTNRLQPWLAAWWASPTVCCLYCALLLIAIKLVGLQNPLPDFKVNDKQRFLSQRKHTMFFQT